jgi:DNA polymerase-1
MKLVCDACAASKAGCCLSGTGPKPCDLMIVGQSLGPQEVKNEQIFIGPSGEKLSQSLLHAGLDRSKIYITNTVKGFVQPGKAVNKTFVRICGDTYLDKEVKEVKPKVILCLGSVAASFFGYRLVANSYFFDEKYQCYIVLNHHPSKLLYTNEDKIHNEFKQGFIIARDLLDKVKENEPAVNVQILNKVTPEYIRALKGPIALDTETTGLNFIANSIVSIGLCDGSTTYGIPVYDNVSKTPIEENLQVLREELKGRPLIMQNGGFDYKFLKKNGIEATVYFDTLLAHFLIDREAPHGLDDIALKLLHTNLTKGTIDFEKDFKEGTIDVQKYTQYVGNDAWLTYKVYEKLKEEVDKDYAKVFYNVMMPTMEWLAEAEYRGVKVDREYVQGYINTAKYELAALEQDIQNDPIVKDFVCHYVNTKGDSIEGFNIKSPKQLSELLYKHLGLKMFAVTEKGNGETGEAVLEELAAKNKKYGFLQKIADYRHLYKSYRTYLQNLIEFSEDDGRIHCHYHQDRVPSGRLSSSQPNLQNIPKDDADNKMKQKQAKIIRRAFIAEKGYTLIEGDFKAAEFRGLAHYSRDPHMIEMINSGRDIHRVIGSTVYLKAEKDINDTERKIIKTIVFGLMYGRGAKSIAEMLDIPQKEAENIKDTFLMTFKQADVWMKGVQDFARKNGYVKTLTGRKVTLPGVYSKDKEEVAYSLRCAINYPIQGVVGDMTNLAGAIMYKEFKVQNLDAHIIMNIHDSLIVECKEDIKDKVKEIMKASMSTKVKEALGLKVNIEADFKEGTNLGFSDAHN